TWATTARCFPSAAGRSPSASISRSRACTSAPTGSRCGRSVGARRRRPSQTSQPKAPHRSASWFRWECPATLKDFLTVAGNAVPATPHRSEEHTSELQSLAYLVCRLLLEKKKNHHKM